MIIQKNFSFIKFFFLDFQLTQESQVYFKVHMDSLYTDGPLLSKMRLDKAMI